MSEYVVDVPDGMSIAHASDGTYPTCCRELTMCAEVVRCRDCAFCDVTDLSGYFHGSHKHDKSLCIRVDDTWFLVKPDGFCAWGERRGDAQV